MRWSRVDETDYVQFYLIIKIEVLQHKRNLKPGAWETSERVLEIGTLDRIVVSEIPNYYNNNEWCRYKAKNQ